METSRARRGGGGVPGGGRSWPPRRPRRLRPAHGHPGTTWRGIGPVMVYDKGVVRRRVIAFRGVQPHHPRGRGVDPASGRHGASARAGPAFPRLRGTRRDSDLRRRLWCEGGPGALKRARSPWAAARSRWFSRALMARRRFYRATRALVEPGALVGPGTRVWAFAHIMEGARVGRDCNVGRPLLRRSWRGGRRRGDVEERGFRLGPCRPR